MCSPFAALALARSHERRHRDALVIVPAWLAMVGAGLQLAPITVAATSGAPPELSGLAGGLLNTTRQMGGALGLAVLSTIAAGHGGSPDATAGAPPTSGSTVALTVGAAVFIVTAIMGAVALPPHIEPPTLPVTNAATRDDAPSQERHVARRRHGPREHARVR